MKYGLRLDTQAFEGGIISLYCCGCLTFRDSGAGLRAPACNTAPAGPVAGSAGGGGGDGMAARVPRSGCCRPAARAEEFYGAALAGETSVRGNFPLPLPGERAPADDSGASPTARPRPRSLRPVTGAEGFLPRSPAPRVRAGENIQQRAGAIAPGRPPPPAHKGFSPSLRQRGGSGGVAAQPGNPAPQGCRPPRSGSVRSSPVPALIPELPPPGPGSPGACCAPGSPAPSR